MTIVLFLIFNKVYATIIKTTQLINEIFLGLEKGLRLFGKPLKK